MKTKFPFLPITCLFLAFGFTAGAETLNIRELEKRMANNRNDLQIARFLIRHYFNTDRIDELIGLYDANRIPFEQEPGVQVYYGSGLCKKAGMAGDLAAKIRWSQEGLAYFERLAARYPDNPTVRLFRGLTYSHFPKSLELKPAAQEDLDFCLEQNRKGAFNLTRDGLVSIYQACLNMGIEYGDGEYLAYCFEQLKTDIPDPALPVFEAYKKAVSAL
jgi:hypothetical protein